MGLITKTIVVVVCLLALLQLVLSRAAPDKQLCGDKSVELDSIDDLLHTSAEGCADHVQEAFRALVEMVASANVCTMKKVTGITRYYENYLRGPTDGQAIDAESSKHIQALGKFAIAYGMQVGFVCRTILMREFYTKAAKLLEKSDFEAIQEWTRDDSPIARLLQPISKQGEFLVPADFAALAPGVIEKFKLKLTTHNEKLLLVHEVCEKRFRPLYEPVVLPIAHLSRNGFNYMHAYLAATLNMHPRYRHHFARWSRIVFLCEFMKELEVIETPAGRALGSVKVVTDQRDTGSKDKVASSSLERIVPFTIFVMINGRFIRDQRHIKEAAKYRLYSAADFKMKSAISSFNATLSETERFREKLLGNKWSLLFATFKSDESTRKLFKKALQMVMAARRESDHQEELKSVEKKLIGLVDSKKNSAFFKVLSKIARRGMAVVRFVSLVLLIAMLLVLIAVPNLVSCPIELAANGKITEVPLTYTFGFLS